MVKKKSNTSEKPLKVSTVGVSRAASVSDMARGAPPRIDLTIEVDNPGDTPIHAWGTMRTYSYDAETHILTVKLAELPDELPPGIKRISEHIHLPIQIMVNARSSAKIKIQLPGSVRRLTPGQGIGMSFVEDPIGKIDQVEIHIQHATEPIEHQRGENPADFRKRLRGHGDVVRANITPTAEAKEK